MSAAKTIMVVDDDQSMMTIIEHFLSQEEYAVQTAFRGQEVFARLEEQRPDLIILDIMLPDMSGLEVLKRLKGAAETSSIPVILLTGKGEYRDVLLGYREGCDYYISKPFTSGQLLHGVGLFLRKSSSKKDSTFPREQSPPR